MTIPLSIDPLSKMPPCNNPLHRGIFIKLHIFLHKLADCLISCFFILTLKGQGYFLPVLYCQSHDTENLFAVAALSVFRQFDRTRKLFCRLYQFTCRACVEFLPGL